MTTQKRAVATSQNGNTPPIKRWRMREGLTQEQAAAALEVHRITYIRLENWAKPIGRKLARKVASFTGQKPGDVLDQYEKNARTV